MSEVKVNKISPRSGTTVTLGDSGDTIAINSGASLTGFTSTGIDDNATSTAITIDSSENVLYGVSTASGFQTSSTEKGSIIYADSVGGFATNFDSGNNVYLNRLGSDGTIITLRKDGSTVGSIGANGGDAYIGTGDTGVRFRDVSDAIVPFNTSGSIRDDAISLGEDVYRFKDAYLSGNIYLGGTTSANALDDYEEGTFTPVIADATSGGNTSPTTFTGQYTKIGSLVCVGISCFNIDKTGLTAGNNLYIRGLPFPVKAGVSYQGACTLDRFDFTGFVTAQFQANFSYVILNDMIDSTFEAILTIASIISSGGSDLSISATYLTDS